MFASLRNHYFWLNGRIYTRDKNVFQSVPCPKSSRSIASINLKKQNKKTKCLILHNLQQQTSSRKLILSRCRSNSFSMPPPMATRNSIESQFSSWFTIRIHANVISCYSSPTSFRSGQISGGQFPIPGERRLRMLPYFSELAHLVVQLSSSSQGFQGCLVTTVWRIIPCHCGFGPWGYGP